MIKRTTNGGTTWTADATQFNQALTQVTCPSSTVCYAAGDRGTVLASSDGGVTWSQTASADGNPIYGLSCPTTSTCYAVDNYAHVETTTNGGATWTLSSTPVTTPGVNVPGSGGPNPFAGLFGVSCPQATTCVAVGGFPPTSITGETAPPIVTTTDGTDWSLQNSGAPTGDNLMAVSCISGTTTCYAVGYGGTIVTTTDLTDWSTMTSGTTQPLIGITCLSTTSCVATGAGRHHRRPQRQHLDAVHHDARRQRLPRRCHLSDRERLLRRGQAGRHPQLRLHQRDRHRHPAGGRRHHPDNGLDQLHQRQHV